MGLSVADRQVLGKFLESLEGREIEKLAGALEKARALAESGSDVAMQRLAQTMPVNDMMDMMRPRLRTMRLRRTPSLKRLLCEPFGPLLDDAPPAEVKERVPAPAGRGAKPERATRPGPDRPWAISRQSVEPLWNLVKSQAPGDIAELEPRFVAAVKSGNGEELAAIAQALYGTAAAVVDAAVKPILAGNFMTRRDLALRMGLDESAPRPLIDAHVHDLARTVSPLRHHAELMPAFVRVLGAANSDGVMDGHRFRQLTDRMLNQIKDDYTSLSERIGPSASLLPVMVMRRLEQPWDMLRLPKSLTRAGAETLLRETDLGVIMDMLAARLEDLAAELQTVVPRELRGYQKDGGRRMPAGEVEHAAVAVTEFARSVATILRDVRFPTGSEWRKALAEAQVDVTRSIEDGLLNQFSLVITHLFDGGTGTQSESDRAVAGAAVSAAAALAALMAMPGAQGSVSVVRVAIRGIKQRLWKSFEQAVDGYWERQREAAASGMRAGTHGGPMWERLTRMSDVLRALFPDDERGDAAEYLQRPRIAS